MNGFIQFIRQQGVVGLAIGFILGGSVNQVIKSLVGDVINPLIGLVFTSIEELNDFVLGPVLIGNFISALLNFIILAAVVYFIFKGMKLDRIDVKKQ
ncbi:MAG: hypothetical protein COT81_02910 [Candidatus Buchananbacteria bacterium CG10_big_fil_rev_8_21_14_0_10_42_9]|uniref:Large conductance mechanosensitive channel protein MscL n=1 Tax=Candidatus Buchananbacteria bacterium CG10_big_fil_rev_8_21_14_0_10_42_9 TaxID=1974526 RepID=A0A2H0W156_9BACT|nr:MAG: hypothetical protein COT81_02910 [Candidatus Buchananbacteria bacterium CG10_big_fil_rev_8_21_14_0_10_42_9]